MSTEKFSLLIGGTCLVLILAGIAMMWLLDRRAARRADRFARRRRDAAGGPPWDSSTAEDDYWREQVRRLTGDSL